MKAFSTPARVYVELSQPPARPHGIRLYARLVSTLSEHTEEIGGLPVFWRSVPHAGTPALYLHGVPSSSDDWIAPGEHHGRRSWWRRWWRPKRDEDEWVEPPLYETGFLERSGGLAPDLPGFGRSGKPAYLRYTIDEYAGFIERFLDHLEVERVNLVMHDWGVVGLAFAQAHPERVQRLVMMNTIPLLPDYSWHRGARLWRTPLLGEARHGREHAQGSAPCHEPVERRRGTSAQRFPRLDPLHLRRRHPASDPASAPQLAARAARASWRRAIQVAQASADPLGPARPLHPTALRRAVRRRPPGQRTGAAARRRPLVLA